MGNTQSYVLGSLSVCTVYLVYAKIYCSYCLLKSNELQSNRLPSFAYLYVRYLARCLSRTPGYVNNKSSTVERELEYTVLGCRLDSHLLRRFCAAAGYSWDYPDSEYRDIPLCFPESLCPRLLLMLLTDEYFKLSPAGLVRVRQTVKTLQPIDELKKGPFKLQARVLCYRRINAGVEVDIYLSATAASSCLIWESVWTLLSTNKLHEDATCATLEHKDASDVKQVDLRFPTMPCFWSSTDVSSLLFSALCGPRLQISPRLWMLSVCLAEIEKHKGVKVLTAPASVTAQFTEEPLMAKDKVNIRFWDLTESSAKVCFDMKKHGSCQSLVMGHILRHATG